MKHDADVLASIESTFGLELLHLDQQLFVTWIFNKLKYEDHKVYCIIHSMVVGPTRFTSSYISYLIFVTRPFGW